MDAMQLTRNVSLNLKLTVESRLKKTIFTSKDLFFKQRKLPVITSYKKIDGNHNRNNIMCQNAQKYRELIFLCEHNLLFFLLITKQFNIIQKLYKTPTCAVNPRYIAALLRKKHYRIRQKRKRALRIRLTKNSPWHAENSIQYKNELIMKPRPTFTFFAYNVHNPKKSSRSRLQTSTTLNFSDLMRPG